MVPGVASVRPTPGISSRQSGRPDLIWGWLACVAVLVVIMIAVGGATRLTDSGLSITEWKPILGAIPPLTDADWQTAFSKYKQIPEYSAVNEGMSLAAFKTIFWWEWGHRFLGRFIGVAFAIPMAVLWLRGAIPGGYHLRLLALLALGGLQGFIGWYMVQSGLVDRIDVSQYRLALHLSVAFVILGMLVWIMAEMAPRDRVAYIANLPSGSRAIAIGLVGLVSLQVVLGAFVAGTKAGLTYNTWPLMDGQWIPDGLYALTPWYMSVGEDHLTIQFNHRVVAYLVIGLSVLQAIRVSGTDDGRVAWTAWALVAGLAGQAGLGIWTLLAAEGRIPILLGVAHQTIAAILFALAVWHMYAATRATRH